MAHRWNHRRPLSVSDESGRILRDVDRIPGYQRSSASGKVRGRRCAHPWKGWVYRRPSCPNECDAAFKQGGKFAGWTTGAADDAYYHPLMLPQGIAQLSTATLDARGTAPVRHRRAVPAG